MKFTKVTYSRLFPLQQFSNERIEVEIQVDDHESEVAALELAKKTVMQFHEQSVKQEEERQVVNIKEEPSRLQKDAIEKIKKCQTFKELGEWELFVFSKNGSFALQAYLEQQKKIQNGN